MIKTAVWSYWEDNRRKVNGGFRTKKECATTMALSLEKAKHQFEETILVTNSFGKEFLIDKYRLRFNKVYTELDKFNYKLDSDHWAYIKIYTYNMMAQMGKPFVHIDNDVIIFDRIHSDTLRAPLFFQNPEDLKRHTGYVRLLQEARSFPEVRLDVLDQAPDYALNCGVVGANDLEIIKEWHEMVANYLFSEKNAEHWKTIDDKHSQNHMFEQYFISSLAKFHGIESQIATLLGLNFYQDARTKFRYTHLWGETKRDSNTMKLVQNRLYKDHPEYVDRLEIKESHAHIFDDVYRAELWGKGKGSGGGSTPEITVGYRDFLQNFLKSKKIKTVADFGCGDWQFSKLIDWSEIAYTGFDCVQNVVNKNNIDYKKQGIEFKYAESISQIDHAYDLLIVKDVLIHWTNAEIIEFFAELNRNRMFKYVLITNQAFDRDKYNKINEDISTGQFHNIDIRIAPFNVTEAEVVYTWDSDSKLTYLLTY